MIAQRITQSLRYRLVVSSVLIQIMFVSLLVAHSINLIEDNLLKQSEVRLHELERLLNTSLAAPLIQQDFEVLQEILNDSIREDGIIYFELVGSNGQLITKSGGNAQHIPHIEEHLTLASSVALGNDTFDAHIDLIVAGIKYGKLHYGISLKSLDQIKSALLEDSVLIAIIGIVFSGLALFFSGMWLTRNLTKLAEASQEFAGGNLCARVHVDSKDEVRYLAQAFNYMAESLDTRIQDLHHSQKEQKLLLKNSQQEKARLTSLLEVMTRGILFETLDERVAYYNPALIKILGLHDSPNLIGEFVSLVAENTKKGLKTQTKKDCLLNKSTFDNGSSALEFELLDGAVVIQRYYPVYDEENDIVGTLWIYEDVTVERQTAEQLVHLAEHDFLTGLYNRRKFEEEMNRQVDICRRHNTELALVFFDVDDFKYINDAFGHKYGDEVLNKVANDVGVLTRREELFCRLGGDEFAILVPDASLKSAQLLAERVRTAVSNISFQREEKRIRVTSSIGISMFPRHAVEMDELLVCADIAMYQAKDAGKNTWKVFEKNQEASQQLLKRINWDGQISDALENDSFDLYYQGVFSPENNELFCLEALVRMKVEGESNVILPGQFIPFAERSGKIIEIDRWVLKKVITTLAENPTIICISVNVSGRSFDDPTLAQFIVQTLETNNVKPQRLLLELTETAAVSDLHDAQRFINAMRDYGCKIAIDDFGSGYASFIYLKHLEADVVKIDGLFTHDLVKETDNQLFIKAIVDIAHGLNKKIVAEFVEDENSLELLVALGVDYVQGFYFQTPSESFPWITDLRSCKSVVENIN